MTVHTLRRWEERPVLSAAMLNPALIAAAICWAAKRYEAKSRQPMPLEYAFLVVPICFHALTRNALPSTTATHMPRWVNENQESVFGLAERASKFAPHVREGLRFGLRSGMLTLRDGGFVAKISHSARPVGEVRDILASAAMFGSWAAKTGSPASVFTLFGVMP